jgi:hypothetical protein
MRTFSSILFSLLIIQACNSGKKEIAKEQPQKEESKHFFPVTSYLQGQINSIAKLGINPFRTISKNGVITDSSWLKVESFNTAFSGFTTPPIDTANLTAFFNEEKFNDQTIGKVTFLYTHKAVLPDTLKLQSWSVYIDPETSTVSRIYMEKAMKDTIQQLTWVNDAWCSIRTIVPDEANKTNSITEEKIVWKF